MNFLKKTFLFYWRKPFERQVRKTGLFFIAFYKCHLSCFFGGACRFTPSCSCYAEEALQKLALGKALRVICGRILRCRPFYRDYGYDPVRMEDGQK